MRSSLAVIVTTFVAATAAQSNYTLPAGFNIGLVTPATLGSWCLAETNTCPPICGGAANINTCDATTLNFTCTCENGTTPDVSLYQNTVPFFVCQENYRQCVNNHPNDLQGQDYCKGNATCGTLNATATQTTTTSSAASTTAASTAAASSGSTGSSSHSSAAAAATSTGAAIALQMAQDHSTSLLTAVLLAVFGVIL